jgi:hypothetical protein
LQLASTQRAAQLLMAAVQRGHRQLLQYSLGSLQAHLVAAAGSPTAEEAATLVRILIAAIQASSSLATLQALLSRGLPFQLGAAQLRQACLAEGNRAAKVRLL